MGISLQFSVIPMTPLRLWSEHGPGDLGMIFLNWNMIFLNLNIPQRCPDWKMKSLSIWIFPSAFLFGISTEGSILPRSISAAPTSSLWPGHPLSNIKQYSRVFRLSDPNERGLFTVFQVSGLLKQPPIPVVTPTPLGLTLEKCWG